MRNPKVTDLRWAMAQDLKEPAWVTWNASHKLPDGFWQRIWEYPYVASQVPAAGQVLDVGGTYPFVLFSMFPEAVSVDCRDLNELDHPLHKGCWPQGRLVQSDAQHLPFDDDFWEYAVCISAIEEMPDPVAVASELVRVARKKVVITVDISEKLGMSRTDLVRLMTFLGIEPPSAPAERTASESPALRRLGQRWRLVSSAMGFEGQQVPNEPLSSVSPILREFGQSPKFEYQDIRVLAMTIEPEPLVQ